ncbi:hypothetical protein G9A89_016331 [Geosiphon pyriformis]|nr:hypothetical protein G9A89_016331 [Geosiphon pyriformis]
MKSTLWQPNFTATHALLNALEDQNKLENRTMNYAWLVEKLSQIKECGTIFLDKEEHVMKCVTLRQLEEYSHNEHKLWRITSAKAEDATTSKLLKIKNNFLSLPKPEYVQTFDIFGNIENNPEEFHEHYQYLTPTREEQKQHLEHSCTSELESNFNPDSNSDNDDNENNSSSFVQNGNKNINDLNSNSNSEIYIVLFDLFKKQKLK